jgi:hypothetical protein
MPTQIPVPEGTKARKHDARFAVDLHVSKATTLKVAAACNSSFRAIAAEFSKRLCEVAEKSSDFDESQKPM